MSHTRKVFISEEILRVGRYVPYDKEKLLVNNENEKRKKKWKQICFGGC